MKSINPSTDESLKEAIKETRIISKIIKSGTTCLLCFENDPFVIEEHHLGGKTNCCITIPLCANCHLRASKNQLSYDKMWCKSNKPNLQKLLFVQKDLLFLVDQINQMIINEFGIN